MVSILIIALGVVVILMGCLFLFDGDGLRNATKLMEDNPSLYS
jgi:hypothetical protein